MLMQVTRKAIPIKPMRRYAGNISFVGVAPSGADRKQLLRTSTCDVVLLTESLRGLATSSARVAC